MRGFIFQIIIILITFSCIDPVNLSLSNTDNRLVVDGLITNQPGPYTVKVGRSLSFDNTQVQPAYFKPEKNAILTIHDNNGELIILQETEPGTYQTPDDFKGNIGHSYILQIQTSEGTKYRSDSEILMDVPPIDSLLYEYITYQRLVRNASGNYVETTSTGFRLQVQLSDPRTKANLYRWKANGIFEYFSVDDNPDIIRCWAPIKRLESNILIATDQYFNGRSHMQEVAILPYDRPTHFLATVEQYSLTESAYQFWERLKDQQLNTGSIFDPSPATIMGNIKNINAPDESVLGFFGASAVAIQSVLINRLNASNFVSPSPYKQPLPGNCLFHEPYATDKKPAGFP